MPEDAPSLAAGIRQQLEEGMRALGLSVTSGETDQLLSYLQLIQRWTQVYNLTAVRNTEGILGQHLLDSLAMLPALRRHTGGAEVRLLDVGSGAGLPGLPLAIAAPELRVTCVDTVAKKVGFMRQVISELALTNATALHARVEKLSSDTGWNVVTSRAFASLADFVNLTEPLLAAGGCWIAMKGRRPSDEITALTAAIEVFHVEPLKVPSLAAERCLVWLRRRNEAPSLPTGASAR